MHCLGIDAGSRAIKVVLLDADSRELVAWKVGDQGVRQVELATELMDAVLEEAGVARAGLNGIVATGYGRDALEFADTTITEITCHARGVRQLLPEARTIVDIGGQDSKVLRLEAGGAVRDFSVNDRCAAGTGRFLEVVAGRLDADLQDLGRLAASSETPSAISSMCVVFAETEIVGLLSAEETVENIAAGVQTSIAKRVAAMAGRRVVDPVVFTGGVALVPGMQRALESALGREVGVPPTPQLTGALGAALLAAKGT